MARQGNKSIGNIVKLHLVLVQLCSAVAPVRDIGL
jgi:hypothetical protein